MPKRLDHVQPPLSYLEPRFKPRIFNSLRAFSGLYLKSALKIDSLSVKDSDKLVDAYRDFEDARSRLIIAFRHPHVDDGPITFHLIARLLPRLRAHAGDRNGGRTHAHFVYGRNVPVWSGGITAFLFPRVAGLAVQKGRYDSKTISMLRQYLAESRYPLAIAPEAQVTYHNEKVGTLDPGVSQLAFWCMEDLAKSGRPEDVRILPVTTRYLYREKDEKKLERLLRKVEKDLRIKGGMSRKDPQNRELLYKRMERMLDNLLERMEELYMRFERAGLNPDASRQERIDNIVNAALKTAERYFGLDSRGETLQRVLSVRQKGLSHIFRADIPSIKALTRLERALADRIAAESLLMLQHMELADVLEYFRWDYLSPDSSWDRFVETALNLHDIASRLKGGTIADRAAVFHKRIEIRIGNPLSVVDYLSKYSANRRQAVSMMTSDLYDEFSRLSAAKLTEKNRFSSEGSAEKVKENSRHEQTRG